MEENLKMKYFKLEHIDQSNSNYNYLCLGLLQKLRLMFLCRIRRIPDILRKAEAESEKLTSRYTVTLHCSIEDIRRNNPLGKKDSF